MRALLVSCLVGLMSSPVLALHFDVELKTDPGPVAGARITTDFHGDLGLAGQLPIDGETGFKIYPAYFGDLEGGPYLTDDPGFQAFAGTFVQGEVIAFRAVGALRWWNPRHWALGAGATRRRGGTVRQYPA